MVPGSICLPANHPLADQVALLIKTHRPSKTNQNWNRLKAEAAKDHRLHILERTLPRTALLKLYAACECFISLHRAEGFGRGIAEALLLGLDVIATDHGGNTDFCKGPLANPVRCHMVRVKNGEYPYHRGQEWAQPCRACCRTYATSSRASASCGETISQRWLNTSSA